MPWASSRSSAEARASPSPTCSRKATAEYGSRSARARARRTSSASATRCCCAPSCRSRSMRRRAASAASMIRACDARSSFSARALDLVAAQRLLVGAPLGDVEDRAVHPLLAARALHAVPAIEDPAQLAVGALDAVLEVERLPVVDGVLRLLEHRLAILGADDAHDRAPRVGAEEVARRVARDPLDLVADELERVVGVPRGAVDRAGHVGHERAQQRLAGVAIGEGALAAAGHRSTLAHDLAVRQGVALPRMARHGHRGQWSTGRRRRLRAGRGDRAAPARAGRRGDDRRRQRREGPGAGRRAGRRVRGLRRARGGPGRRRPSRPPPRPTPRCASA